MLNEKTVTELNVYKLRLKKGSSGQLTLGQSAFKTSNLDGMSKKQMR